ncbi:Fe(3+) ABC transporter substrate-binding protein [Reinekea sp.]|uniref:Fe(3+) ABC transporter substrate-binding protein n=1 Tax=Reinekea sp. TaxID=1970455 RepID=UPI00257E6FA3|nr:Fe(3+) ABC transporter substrate-binding protein [Reinekea sp.]
MRSKSLTVGVFATVVLTVGLQFANAEVNIYSARTEALIKPLLEQFTAQTGIKVNLVSGGDDELISRLRIEGSKSQADLLITADAGRLHRAKELNLLRELHSERIDAAVPANLRDVDGTWIGLTMRARPIFYRKSAVDPTQLSTYEALTDAQWAGRICIRSSSNIYNQSLIASMIASVGADAAETFASGLVANLAKPPGGGDTDQLKAAAAGVCDLAIANTYYFGRLMASDSAEDRAVAEQLGVFWPNQGDRGTHVNISGVALTRAAKNSVDAIALVEFMLTPEAQNWYSEVNNEYPVVSGVEPSAKLASLGVFNADALNLTLLGENNRAAVELMDRAGWK